MSTVEGIKLEAFKDPIRDALRRYSDISNGAFVFDLNLATKLELTPEKPNSARSLSVVEHLGDTVGNIAVIVFKHGDGTGDDLSYPFNRNMAFGSYPKDPRVNPRSKSSVHSEAHLTIATIDPFFPEDDPKMFLGSLDLIGFTTNAEARIGRLACLGQENEEFYRLWRPSAQAKPTATFTTGYLEGTGDRFGDPHAVYNKTVGVQVAGFLGLSRDFVKANPSHANTLRELGAVVPKLEF